MSWEKKDASPVVRDGLIHRFEFTYELAWKTTKAYLEDQGIIDINSPKAVLKERYISFFATEKADEPSPCKINIWFRLIKPPEYSLKTEYLCSDESVTLSVNLG